MRRGRIFIFLALILIIGLVVVALVFNRFLAPAQAVVETQVSTVRVYIAGQNIPQGEMITEDVLATIEIPQDKVVSVMFTFDQSVDLVGKTARYPLEQGVVITRSMVSDGILAPSGPEWANLIPSGMTAIAIPTSRLAAVAYGVTDGAHVDLSACFIFVDVDPSYQSILPNFVESLTAPYNNLSPPETPAITLGVYPQELPHQQGRTEVEPSFQQGIYVVPSEGQRPRLVCQMLLQNVVVLKMGSFPLEEPQVSAPTDQQNQAQVQQAPEKPDIVTLIVSPQDSVTLSYLIYSGAKVNLTLRNAADETRTATEAATLQFLLSQYNIPVPAKLPYATQPRIDELITPFLPNDIASIPPEQ